MWTRLQTLARSLLRRRAVEAELDEELAFHLGRETEALIEAGATPAEARRRARARFGAIDAIREECREARGTYPLESLLLDLRYAIRLLWRSPGFAATAILTLALTIGAVSTVASLGYTFLIRGLPVPDPGQIVTVLPTRAEQSETGFVSYPDFVHFRDANRTVSDLAAVYPGAPLFVTDAERGRQITGAVVSHGFFGMLRIRPALGRFFVADEDRVPGRDAVAVLAHDFWQTWFGGRPDVLGQDVEVNGTSFTVIGVAPAGFRGIRTAPAQIYLPTMMLGVGYRWCDVLGDRDCTILTMIGRLENATVHEATADFSTILPAEWIQPDAGSNDGISIQPLRGTGTSAQDEGFLRLLGLVSGVLLLVCCANLSGLLFARGRTRSGEIAIRAAIGAPRRRIFRQLLTESALLATIGGAAGMLLSLALTGVLDAAFYRADSSGRPLAFDFSFEPPIVAAIVGLALFAGLLFGAVPALIMVRHGAGGCRPGANRHTRPATAPWLLGLQAAVAVALVIGALQLSASAHRLVTGANFDASRVALMRLRPRLIDYPPERAQEYVRGVVAALEQLPGVSSASVVGTGIALAGLTGEVALDGPDAAAMGVGYIEVGPRYFETLATPVLSGREFTLSDDTAGPPVAVINQTLAARLWPATNPLGQTLRVEGIDRTVVGVVADVPLQARSVELLPYVYVPFWQKPDQTDARVQVRVEGDPAEMLATLAATARGVDPDVPVSETLTLPARMAGLYRPLRMTAAVVAYAAGLAAALSAIGLYAALTSAVASRRREIGVRQAVGATRSRIVALIAGEGMGVIAAGVVGGVVLAAVSMRALGHLLYGTATGDLPSYAGGVILVLLVGLAASWIPARRAARTHPMEALRLQ